MKPQRTPSDSGCESGWQKTAYTNLIRYKPSGVYFARFRVKGKLIRRSLKPNYGPKAPKRADTLCVLAVLRVGNGTETLGNVGNSVFIDQFTTSGSTVNTVTVPNTGANALIMEGSSTSGGYLKLSADGNYLVFGGV